MKFSLLINMKMPTVVGIFIFISWEIFMLSYDLQLLVIWDLLAGQISCPEKFYNLRAKCIPSP